MIVLPIAVVRPFITSHTHACAFPPRPHSSVGGADLSQAHTTQAQTLPPPCPPPLSTLTPSLDRSRHHPPCASLRQCALTDLDLSQASNDAGAARLARALHANRSLVVLTLHLNRISTTGGIAFAEALRLNTTLTSASLSGNCLTDAAAVALAASLAANQTMTRLDLSRNSIRAIGAQALRQALHTNTSLVALGELEALPIAVGLRASIEWCVPRLAATCRDVPRLRRPGAPPLPHAHTLAPMYPLACTHWQVPSAQPGAHGGPRARSPARDRAAAGHAQTPPARGTVRQLASTLRPVPRSRPVSLLLSLPAACLLTQG